MAIVWFWIRDIFTMLWEIIVHIFDLIVSLCSLLGAYGEVAFDIVRALPVVFLSFGIVAIIIMILYKILGRNSKEE